MNSKYKIGEHVMVTSPSLYPDAHHIMGSINDILKASDEDYIYGIHYGITGIDDLKNVPESDIIPFA